MLQILGGKGANLAEMSKIGLPVPPGFTITTEECISYYDNEKILSESLKEDIKCAVRSIELSLGKNFGSSTNPLLVSVRSGSMNSMPGMMDTILNLGLNDITVSALSNITGNRRFSMDSYRRFIQMYGNVVLGIPHYHFEDAMNDLKISFDVTRDSDLTVNHLDEVIRIYIGIVKNESKRDFPTDVYEQLYCAVEAVFRSWMNDRAIVYRKINGIPDSYGTAATVQAMVFGNMNNSSGTGVVFTRNPSTGVDEVYGEYLINAQGEDVVSGTRTPSSIASYASNSEISSNMKQSFNDLFIALKKLESYYCDMQDVEFTIEDGKLWILQTRSGKRSAASAIKIAVDMVQEGIISKEEAIGRIDPKLFDRIIHPHIDKNAERKVIARGLAASPGAVSGVVVFSASDAEEAFRNGQKVILVRHETSPDDISGMHAAVGILTASGGMTSHAAVVARGMGKSCISGCEDITINYNKQEFLCHGITIKKFDSITIDGSSGEVMIGDVPMVMTELSSEFKTFMNWVDDIRGLRVRANAETPTDCSVAMDFGADGIGLCRTEHMFFNKNRILLVREMIISDDPLRRQNVIAKLLDEQKSDFYEIFKIIKGLPINIRLLDPPLHEFLPFTDADIAEFSTLSSIDIEVVRTKLKFLHEMNPMLGHRGSRIGITFPEIYEMQIRAIFGAYVNALKDGVDVKLEIMVPFIMDNVEFDNLHSTILHIKNIIEVSNKVKIECEIGTMIEIPRACLLADRIAKKAQYFSFGTNDLTQAMLCISRDDAFKFMEEYQNKKIISYDPFVTLDIDGVGEMIKIASERGRKTRSDIKLGICGEHGGDPASIKFCTSLGFQYTSCSPYRIPGAKLAAAQALLN